MLRKSVKHPVAAIQLQGMHKGLAFASRSPVSFCQIARPSAQCPNFRCCARTRPRHLGTCMSTGETTNFPPSTSTRTAAHDKDEDAPPAADLVQYLVLRKDLWTSLEWPLGSIIAQACHASTAALWLSKDTTETSAYCSPDKLDHMHKVSLSCPWPCNVAYQLQHSGREGGA